jgi:hypothetical protein
VSTFLLQTQRASVSLRGTEEKHIKPGLLWHRTAGCSKNSSCPSGATKHRANRQPVVLWTQRITDGDQGGGMSRSTSHCRIRTSNIPFSCHLAGRNPMTPQRR